jgi:hypothetical protein
VALRPRLSPGVPLSRDGAADLGDGTEAVKHISEARQLCLAMTGKNHFFWNNSQRPSPWVYVRLLILYHTVSGR